MSLDVTKIMAALKNGTPMEMPKQTSLTGDALSEKDRTALGLIYHVVQAEDAEEVIATVKQNSGEAIDPDGNPSQVVSGFPRRSTNKINRKDAKYIALLASLGYDASVSNYDDLDLELIDKECRAHLAPLLKK